MSNYDLRNSQNFEIPFARLCLFESSFFPSALRLWNSTGESIRKAPTLSVFKSNTKKQPFRIHQFPSTKDRLNDIILTRIRHNCSNLNADLFRVNISANSNCRPVPPGGGGGGGRNRWLLCACSRLVRPPLYNATVRYTVSSNSLKQLKSIIRSLFFHTYRSNV